MKKLMNQRWFIALVFMVLYKPAMFSQMPALHTFDTISNVFKVMVIAVLGVWFVYFYQKVSLFFVGIVFFEVWRVLATIYCGGNYTSLFIAILNALAICLVVEMGLKTDPDALLDGASFTLGLFVLINFATVLLFPQGMYEFNTFTQNYFLGYRNNSIMLFFPAIIFSIVRSLRKYNKLTLSSFVITAVSFATVILAFSATSVIGMTVFTLFLLLALINKMPNFLNIITYLAINIAYFFGVIILRLQEAFAFIIVDMLGRDLTFTGRTKIWDSALAAFAKSPVFGVGEIENQASRDLIGATHAHNYYLDLLYKSGPAVLTRPLRSGSMMGFKGFFDPFPHPEILTLPHKSQGRRKQNRQDRVASPPHRPQHTFCNNAGMEGQQRSSIEIHPGDMVRIPE